MRRALLACALPFLAIGCNAVLGWDSASVDPLLEAGASGGTQCERYCAVMAANCSGVNLKYITPSVCVSMCSQLDPGIEGDVGGPSIACRATYAAKAATEDPVVNCERAGPLTAGPCNDDPCRAFCTLDVSYCPMAYKDADACVATCDTLKSTYDPSLQIAGDQQRNTLNCRLYHLQAAFVNSNAQMVHCMHTSAKNLVCSGT